MKNKNKKQNNNGGFLGLPFLKVNPHDDDVGVEDTTPNLKFFFKLFARKIGRLLSVNILMLMLLVPIVTIALIYLWGPTTPVHTETVSAPLYGINILERADGVNIAPGLSVLTQIFTDKTELPMVTPTNMIWMILCGLFLFITWGWQHVGFTYIMRGLVRGDPVFIISDYFYAIKHNFKQGFLFGMIDFSIIAILVIDFLYFYNRTGVFRLDLMYFIIFALVIIYFFMRFYTYMMLITFDIKTFKIFKNALIFSVLGFKRNIMAAIGIALMLGLYYLIYMLSFPLGLSLMLVFFMAAVEFIKAYAAYPIITKYMVKD